MGHKVVCRMREKKEKEYAVEEGRCGTTEVAAAGPSGVREQSSEQDDERQEDRKGRRRGRGRWNRGVILPRQLKDEADEIKSGRAWLARPRMQACMGAGC